MTQQSEPELLVLHAVRLTGFTTSDAAEHAGTSQAAASSTLQEAGQQGWVQDVTYADLAGWSLTDSGITENERQLAAERLVANPAGVMTATHREFLPLNARLLRAVTGWQTKPTEAETLATNDHTDPAWDDGVMNELDRLGREVAPLVGRLSAVLARFDEYSSRYRNALRKDRSGGNDCGDKTTVDSCHRVLFQLHEDLVATLGIDRRDEN